MKRINRLYDKINDIDIIMDMYDNVVRKNMKNKKKIKDFDDYYSCNIINIKNIINSKNYIPGKYNIFLIREPKYRIIMSQSINDKVINHLVAKYFLVNVFDKTFIDDNAATRVGKGTHYGIKKIKKYLQIMKKNYGTNFYVLKFDISKYFYNIDHEIVKNIIKSKIKDKNVINIINNIIDSTDSSYVNKIIEKLKDKEIFKINNLNIKESEKIKLINEVNNIPLYEKKKGFPIGNMTSQIIAILYLNELDYYIKEKLNIKYYVRYMDDGVLLYHDKKYLQFCLNEIECLLKKYELKLNFKKSKVDSIKNPLDFLGFNFIIKKRLIMKVRNNIKRNFKYVKSKESFISYLGHLKYGNCKSLIHNKIFYTIRQNI